MPFTFTMPKLSPTMEEGTIAKWHKKEGEYIEAGEVVLEIATDKATVEHEAIDEGWLRQILIPEGGSAIVNQPIAIFTEDKEESLEGFTVEAPAPTIEETIIEKPTKPTPVTAASMSQPSFVPEPPLEKEIHVKAATKKQPASPLAKRLAKEQGLDIATVKGSGPGGRVTKKDLEHAQPAGVVTFGSEAEPEHAPGSYEEIPLSPMRKIIGKRLQESKSYVPHFYVRQVVDAQPLITLRKQLKAHNLKVTFNDLIIRAAALALREHPSVNAGFNSVNQTLIQFKTIDISVAVTVEGGLITPIIRHADYKNVGQISTEVRALAERARMGKLQEQEYKGGSFCVSNLGMYGISEFTAVINPPQAAILAVGGIEDRPVVRDGQIVPGKELVLNLSADHRVIDGALGAQFMKTLQHILENPIALMLT